MSRYINLEEATDLFRGIDATMVGSFVADTLESLLTIEVSEDAISREEVYRAIITCGEVDNDLNHLYEVIENFPSVIPKPKEGEWVIEEKESIYGKKIRLTCSECGDVFNVTEAAFPYERYCRYCGSRNIVKE